MIVNFKAHGISRDAYKLIRTLMLIKKLLHYTRPLKLHHTRGSFYNCGIKIRLKKGIDCILKKNIKFQLEIKIKMKTIKS